MDATHDRTTGFRYFTDKVIPQVDSLHRQPPCRTGEADKASPVASAGMVSVNPAIRREPSSSNPKLPKAFAGADHGMARNVVRAQPADTGPAGRHCQPTASFDFRLFWRPTVALLPNAPDWLRPFVGRLSSENLAGSHARAASHSAGNHLILRFCRKPLRYDRGVPFALDTKYRAQKLP